MKFRTEVTLPKPPFSIDRTTNVLMLGSCFAEGVGEWLTKSVPTGHCLVNPFGVLYNPASIAIALESLMEGEVPTSDDLFQGRDGLWHSWMHSSAFSAATKMGCFSRIAEKFCPAAEMLKGPTLVCLTWGTTDVFRLADEGLIVGNCHKEDSRRFYVEHLTVQDVVDFYRPIFSSLADFGSKVVITISPYRYVKAGLHQSTLSKSILHLAAAQLEEEFPFVHHFPAYEIVVDELRDYRFYAPDMLHPSAQAVEYVWERFRDWLFTPEMQEYAAERYALNLAREHRPINPDSKEAKRFLAELAEREHAFAEKWGEENELRRS